MWEAGELQMFPPTIASLRFLEPHRDAEAAMAASALVGVPRPVLPKVRLDADGKVTGIVRPGEPGYDEQPEPQFVIGFPR
jgi:hypothetical protein